MQPIDFLRMIAGNNGFALVRLIKEGSQETREFWVRPLDHADNPDKLNQQLRDYSENGWHVYAQVSQVAKNSKTPLANRFIWADLDDKDFSSRDAMYANIARVGLEPTLTVDSGGGLHLYWILDNPLAPTRAKILSRAMAWQLGGDPVHDPTRIMRIPGTKNPKKQYEGGREAREINVSGKVYDQDSIPRDLDLENLNYKLAMMIVNGPQTPGEDRSSYDFMVASKLMDSRATDDQIIHLFKTYQVSGKYHSEGVNASHYLNKTLESARVRHLKPFAGAEVRREPAEWVVLSYKELLESKEADFLIQDLLPVGGSAMLAAPPKARKSWMAMQMAYAVATGGEFLEFPVDKPRRVVYVQAELPNWVVAARFRQMYGEDADLDNLKFVTVPRADLLTETDMDGLIQIVSDTQAELIIIDPIANFWSGDENRASAVSGLFDNFARLKPLNCAVVVVHHTKKLQHGDRVTANSMRGSNVFFARPDAVISLTPHEDYTTVGFDLRAAAPREPLKLFVDSTGKFTTDSKHAPVINEELRKKLLRVHQEGMARRKELGYDGPTEGKSEQENPGETWTTPKFTGFNQATVNENYESGINFEVGTHGGEEVHNRGNAQDASVPELPDDFDPNQRTRNKGRNRKELA